MENTHRRARRRLPRKRDIRSMTDQDMNETCDRPKNTPPKRLGWKTPAEVFREKMLEKMRCPPYPEPNKSRRSRIARTQNVYLGA